MITHNTATLPMRSNNLSITSVLLIVLASILGTADSLAFSKKASTRRDLIQKIIPTSVASAASILLISSDPAQALEACRPKARNCIRTTWTSPKSLSKEDAIKSVREVLSAYPQKGQNGVDCNGWTIKDDSLEVESLGTSKLEYKSCVGPAAISINLGQPFIDDLKLEVSESSDRVYIDVKSSSRMGSSDLFVNKKRVEYLGNELQKIGWEIPEVKYGSF